MPINTRSSPSLRWLVEMFQLFSQDAIKVPTDYRQQVIETKALLRNDTSGLVNSILDFSIEAALVDYTLETNDSTLSNVLTNWLKNINSLLRGKIPTGLNALAKEYFRERWKGSSNLVLMTQWEDVDGWSLPVNMWFLDGEDIVVKDQSTDGVNRIGDEIYFLLTDPKTKKIKRIATRSNERFFVQKPFDSWSTIKPVPYLIRRGIFRNMKFYDLLAGKGEDIVRRAVEYMLLMKKGTERLAATGDTNFIYSDDDLKKVKDDFSRFLAEKRRASPISTPTYTTNFDTEIEHLIPDYEKALKQSLYTSLERRLLAGLGMIDIVESTATSRRESLLNAKPLKSEVESGIKDFSQLLNDVLQTIIEQNRDRHPKKTVDKPGLTAIVRAEPIRAFLNDKDKAIIRSVYDRGALSKQTFTQLCGDVNFDVEVQRREAEKDAGLDRTMYPPVIQNQEGIPTDLNGDEVPEDRTGPESKNFNQASALIQCELCGEQLLWGALEKISDELATCSICQEDIDEKGAFHPRRPKKKKRKKRKRKKRMAGGSIVEVEEDVIYEEAPFKRLSDLPKGVQSLPAGAQRIWRSAFNSSLERDGNELRAIKIAWSAVKKVYRKVGDKWVKRSEKASVDPVAEKKLEVLQKQERVLAKILHEDPNEATD